MATSVLAALDAATWREEAACREVDTALFFVEQGSQDRPGLGNPRTLEAYLLCLTCPVRRDCLAESLTVWTVPVGDQHHLKVRAVGTWGASTARDRAEVRHLPISEAVDALEAGLAERVRERVEAFALKHPERRHRGCSGSRCKRARDVLATMRAPHLTQQ